MRRYAPAARRPLLAVEALEARLVLTNPQTLTIPLDSTADQHGDQIMTVQAYVDNYHVAFGRFDTGSAALTFSAKDQAGFAAHGNPIPIKVPGGAHGEGLGGVLSGDVSQPGTVMVDGLHAAGIMMNPQGSSTNVRFGPTTAVTLSLQAFVGTAEGSPNLPTITGTPILLGGTVAHPGPYAALVAMEGASLDLSSAVPGLSLTLPDLSFVEPTYQLAASPDSTDPVTVPVVLAGLDNHTGPGSSITQGQLPFQNDVSVSGNGQSLSHLNFLFDTGAQVTAISTDTALALGLDIAHPTGWISVSGAGGSTQAPEFTLSELDLPRQDGGIVQFTNVPVAVITVAAKVSGVLGMNLFNSAIQLLYNPFGAHAPSFSVTFRQPPNNNPGGGTSGGGGTSTDPGIIDIILNNANLPQLGGVDHGNGLPGVSYDDGTITGQVFMDFNSNGIVDPGEPGLGGYTVYLDMQTSGSFTPGDPSTITDASGNFEFTGLAPGTYQVGEAVPPGIVQVTPSSGFWTVVAQDNIPVTGVSFGNLPKALQIMGAQVDGLYGQILGRPADPAGLGGWMQFLLHGGPMQQVATAIWDSPEHLQQVVTTLYQTVLHRAPDAGGLASWTAAMQNGMGTQAVEMALLASPEYQQAHPDPTVFVLGLYRDVLGRDADGAGVTAWVRALDNGMSQAQVARLFLTSDEFYRNAVDNLYLSILHRPADAAGEQAWVNALKQGITLETAAQLFLSSPEFWALVDR
ncbi:MAG: DUF4214 domain-containing protein [Planctomycetota bacterium]|nr:MAG: DUF4214 domain-containing protein [Planctomycetota bacterium]